MTVNINNVNLEISAVTPKQYPVSNQPEIAFVGRSNVGKSSLTNILINRKNYAHTSNQPGKTQTLNFYNVENKMYFVDIPGYGFAKVSKSEREKWAHMIETYLTQRKQLSCAISLIDGRHKPTKDDVQMRKFLLYYQIPTLVVATKMDKIKKSQWNKNLSLIKQTMQVDDDQVALFSSKTRMGRDKIWNWIQANSRVVMD